MKKTKATKSQVTDFEAQLRSKYGATRVYSAAEESKLTRVYSTGVLSLDLATGIGGFPAGKVIEIFGKESSGKTALILLAIAAAQQRYNMPSLYVDEEGNTDRGFLEWAHKLGVREDMLTIVQPEYAEEAFSILEDAAVSGRFAYGAVDSLAYMVPKVELEGAYDDQQMGLQARVVRKSLRKVTQKLAKSPMCLAFLNHVTMKIGRVFGCFDYNTRVVFADGTTQRIGEVVGRKISKPVMALDATTGQVVSANILQWFENGRSESFLSFVVQKGGSNGRSQFRCTDDHLILTPRGEVPARKLRVGSKVLRLEERVLNPDQSLISAVPQRRLVTGEGRVLSVTRVRSYGSSGISSRDLQKYDLETDARSYCVDGVFVHNSPESTPGGTAVKHSASMRIRMGTKLQSEIKDSRGQMCGHVVTAYVAKNKCGPPRGLAEFALNYYAGVDNVVAVIDFAVQYGVIKKRGNTFVMDDGKTSLGNYEEARQYLAENLNVLGEIEDMVRKLDLTRKSL